MVKFLSAKWYDEQATIDLVKKTGEMRSYVFSYKQGETDPERLMVQVRDTFEKAKQWERTELRKKFEDNLGIRLAFTESDALEFKPHTTQAKLKAALSLPQETFAPYGAGVKTSILVLQKREVRLSPEQLEIGQDAVEEEDYDVYMARIDSIGYDATGRLNVSEDELHCPPDISWTIMKFNELLGWL